MSKEEHLKQAIAHLNAIREGEWMGEETDDGQRYWAVKDGVIVAEVKLYQAGSEPSN